MLNKFLSLQIIVFVCSVLSMNASDKLQVDEDFQKAEQSQVTYTFTEEDVLTFLRNHEQPKPPVTSLRPSNSEEISQVEINPLATYTFTEEDFLDFLRGYVQRPVNPNFDYRCSRVTDEKYPLCRYIGDVLAEIDRDLMRLTRDQPITINLAENYMEPPGLAKIQAFILGNDYLMRNLNSLNLRSNRFTTGTLPIFLELLQKCPKLFLDISCNLICKKELDEYFTDVEFLKRVRGGAF